MARPSWTEVVLNKLDAQRKDPPRASVGLNFPMPWRGLLIEAARGRGMSMAAYCRRAAMAFVIHDLGLDWTTVMEQEPRVKPFAPIDADPVRMRGFGYGKWKLGEVGEYQNDVDG